VLEFFFAELASTTVIHSKQLFDAIRMN
jgi:hypothetical protein